VHSRLSFLFFFSSSQGLYFVTFLFVCAPPPASSVIGREENRVVSINNTKKSHPNEKAKLAGYTTTQLMLIASPGAE
jgi:hypothetical protein